MDGGAFCFVRSYFFIGRVEGNVSLLGLVNFLDFIFEASTCLGFDYPLSEMEEHSGTTSPCRYLVNKSLISSTIHIHTIKYHHLQH